ncbi:MAG: hypothetical protein JWQ72_2908, partial [Polaromonas sp.]|nr:hypothetical protein [Polaromonas sp.]
QRPVTETLELREQRADIERRAVDRPATAEDLKAFEGASIEVQEMAERAVVNKSARVVEEVVVGTQADTHTQTVSDTVRNTVVEVQKDGVGGQGASMTQPGAAGYRNHFDANFASSGGRYEDYEPAYAYGSQLRSDARYANRSWDDVESDAQRDWSSQNPGSSSGTWERMKSAVRHGWDSVTGSDTGATGSTASSTRDYPSDTTTRPNLNS